MRQQFEFQVSAPLHQVMETYLKTDFFIASMDRAGARSVEIIEESALPDGGRQWKARITESARLPEFLKTSDIFVIINESAFSPLQKQLTFSIHPASSAIPVRLTGIIHLVGGGECTRLQYDVDLSVKLPLLGKKSEALGLKMVGEECKKQAALLGKWAAAI